MGTEMRYNSYAWVSMQTSLIRYESPTDVWMLYRIYSFITITLLAYHFTCFYSEEFKRAYTGRIEDSQTSIDASSYTWIRVLL